MDATEVLVATSAEELGPIAEVLRDQSFLYANLHHDAGARTFALSVERRFPPRKGNWVLEVRGVGGKKLHRPLQAAGDTVKDISWDAGKREVVLRGVVDEIRVSVDSLDLRASRFDPEAGAKRLTFEDLPEDFRKEVQRDRDAAESENIRIRELRRGLHWRGAIAGGILALLLGAYQALLAEGRLLVDLLVLPATGLGTMYACLRTGRSRLAASAYYGLPGMACLMAAMTIVDQGSLMIVFCGGLMMVAAGQAIVLWVHGEQSDLV